MPTPPVSQLRGCSALPVSLFTWGGGWRRQVPRATRVTRAPCPPLPAKCCVSSVGVDLRYHLVAALPSRGHRCPRLSARVPAPCGRLARDSNSPRSPNPRGDGPAAHHPCQDQAAWVLSPKNSFWLRWGVVGVSTPKATSSPGWEQGVWRQWGAVGENWGAQAQGGEGDSKRCLMHGWGAGAAFVESAVQRPRICLEGSCPSGICGELGPARFHLDKCNCSRRDPSVPEFQPRAALEQQQKPSQISPQCNHCSAAPSSTVPPGTARLPLHLLPIHGCLCCDPTIPMPRFAQETSVPKSCCFPVAVMDDAAAGAWLFPNLSCFFP